MSTRERTRPSLELRNTVKEYDGGGETVRALADVDFSVAPGEFVAVVGPSGSGKSTMLNTLGLLDVPTSGTVRVAGRDATTMTDPERTRARREYVGFVFQQFYLIGNLTALENVTLPTVYHDDPDAEERARTLLDRVGLGDRHDHTPDELSGGQKQRVAIARALVNGPDVVLADEPTGNLDRDTGEQVLGEFAQVTDRGVGLVAVTHDPQVAEFADRTVRIVDGQLTEASGEAANLSREADPP